MLSVQGLTTGYGANKSVLDGVDVEVPDGQVVAVLGSNGAGKSTLLRAISGTLPLHGGVVLRRHDLPGRRRAAAQAGRHRHPAPASSSRRRAARSSPG